MKYLLGKYAVLVLALSLFVSCGGGGGGGTPNPFQSDVETVVNPGQPPVASAGTGTTYNGGEIAMLNGSGSTDPNGNLLRYTWVQTGGTNTVQLSDNHAERPVFEVPNANDVLKFSLKVNDGYSDSVLSFVTITSLVYSGATVTPLSRTPFRGSYSFSGAGEDFVISGSYVYLAAGVNRLHIVDISDPVNLAPVKVMTDPFPQAQDVTLIGNYLYHTSYESIRDVHIYASDVTSQITATFYAQAAMFTSDYKAHITSVGNVLYAASGNALRVYQVIDIANPTTTMPTTSIPLPAPAEDVEVVGNYAYVPDGTSGLRIIDVSLATSGTPTFSNAGIISNAGSFDTAGTALDVAVSGNYAYVADGMNGLVILNVSNPASPVLVATIPVSSGSTYGVRSVDVSGNKLLYSDDFDVVIYDVTTPASPVRIGQYRAGNLICKVRMSGSYIYVTDSQGLRTIPAWQVSMPRGPALYTSASGSVREMKVYGDLGFVRMDRRVDILDMRLAGAPVLLSSYTPSGFDWVNGMAIVDNFAYLSEGAGSLKLLRFRNPAAAAVAKTLDAGTGPQLIVANDSYAYVYRNAFPSASVVVYDVANPYTPVKRGYLARPGGGANWIRSMAVKGDRLYLTELNTSGTFRVADVSNPAAPALIGGLASVDLYGLAFRNNYVVSIGNNTGVKVLDVTTTPATPVFVGTGYAQSGYSISVAGSRAYTNSGIAGGSVKVLDMENPLAPSLAGEIAPAGGADLPVVAGQTLFTFYNGTELHSIEREPILETRYISGTAGATLDYFVGWYDEAGGDDQSAKCWVTGGSCTVVTINQPANTAWVSWSLPVSAGDHEIMIAVGNGHYFGTTKDRVRMQ